MKITIDLTTDELIALRDAEIDLQAIIHNPPQTIEMSAVSDPDSYDDRSAGADALALTAAQVRILRSVLDWDGPNIEGVTARQAAPEGFYAALQPVEQAYHGGTGAFLTVPDARLLDGVATSDAFCGARDANPEGYSLEDIWDVLYQIGDFVDGHVEPVAPVAEVIEPAPFDTTALYVTTGASACSSILAGSLVKVEDTHADFQGEVWVEAVLSKENGYILATRLDLLQPLTLDEEEVAQVADIMGCMSRPDDEAIGVDHDAACTLYNELWDIKEFCVAAELTQTDAQIIVAILGSGPSGDATAPAYYRLYTALQQRGIDNALLKAKALAGHRPLIGAVDA